MKNRNITPFVKWVGGKTQLLDRLEDRMPAKYGRYYEPFIGGGALLFDVQPEHAVINDVNTQLLNVYRQLKTNTDLVISEIKELDSVDCDKSRYLEKRALYNNKIASNAQDAECAALMIWLNKHCFNGLYRVNSKGMFNAAYNNKTTVKSMNEDNLRRIGEYLRSNDIEIREGDFEKACDDASDGDFVYFDSPYIPINATANFTDYTKNGFSLEDHKRLAALARKLDNAGVNVMLSNHNVDLIYDLYDGFEIEIVDVRRSVNRVASKRTGKEVIIRNYH